jgi:hypothetical protein
MAAHSERQRVFSKRQLHDFSGIHERCNSTVALPVWGSVPVWEGRASHWY